MRLSRLLFIWSVTILSLNTYAQHIAVKPVWDKPVKIVRGNDSAVMAPSFADAVYTKLPQSILPSHIEKIVLAPGTDKVSVVIDSLHYVPFTEEELLLIRDTYIANEPEVGAEVMYEQGNPVALIAVRPFGIDPLSGNPAKLEYFSLSVSSVQSDSITTAPAKEYAKNSRLSLGDWYKMYVTKTGVHRVTYDDLKNMGMNMEGINPDYITMFGRGGQMLKEVAGTGYQDDVTEIAIQVVTANSGVFAPGDYILFFGEGPVTWQYNSVTKRMEHAQHLYTDKIAYLITVAYTPGRRIVLAEPSATPVNNVSNHYTAVGVYEKEVYSLIKSGRKWFADKFDNYTREVKLPRFSFPDIDLTRQVVLGFGFAGKATIDMNFNILVNNKIVNTTKISRVTGPNSFGRDIISSKKFSPGSSDFDIAVQFMPPNSAALGWLDFITLNVPSKLRYRGPQFLFRDPESVGEDKITEFSLESDNDNLVLWDVSNHSYVHRLPLIKTDNGYKFKAHTYYLREFIAFDGSSFYTPEYEGRIANQDLHATKNYDMIIVTHPSLADQANRLVALHKKKGDITAHVVMLPDIYNEFSSGHPDITAIRDFMKVLYERGKESGYPKYLMLFGNASYDFKDRILNNNNLVPSYQSHNSVDPTVSFVSDDYFGLLDDGEGGGIDIVNGLIDLATGRLPVRTPEQATDALNKIEAYLFNDVETHGDWRNTILVIADDEDNNTHFNQAERLASKLKQEHPIYNINKVYFDAYRQNNTPGGGRFPDANRDITSRVDKGALITNYIGHGGELGWADERVLEIADINAWKNFDRMGLFFTATCEFSRFDNPGHTSAGELVFLNPDGGALAMITTTRLAFSNTNELLNTSFADTVLNKVKGESPRLGDIIKYTKNSRPASSNVRQLTLFGDPSMQMMLPKYSVVTTGMVDAATLNVTDTLSANKTITVSGEIQDDEGQLISSFSGDLYIKVYDKATTSKTLGQDKGSYVANFSEQKNVIYQGKAKINQGLFSATFPVPIDIDYNYGIGKISYYATDSITDAQGYYTDFTIGGFDKQQQHMDELGPQITLHINDSSFVDGGLTSENPILLVNLFDESGINTLGNGVGHDLIAVLDEDQYNFAVLNEFYLADRDSYKSGKAHYQFFNLDDGPHSVKVKSWDIFNNSSEATINFTVKRDIRLDIDDVTAYPVPSKGDVWFKFKHNLFDAALKIEVEIFNSAGTLVRVLDQGKVAAQGYMVDDLKWDGRDEKGAIVKNGVYICRVKVLDRNNNSSAHSVKVVLARL